MTFVQAGRVLVELEGLVKAVKSRDESPSRFARVLSILDVLARQEGVPLAIVGGMAAIHHGYERLTKDIDVVVRGSDLAVLPRVAPRYGIKVIWNDPAGWHKLQCEGVPIDVVPEGGMPRSDAPKGIPGPAHLGVRAGAGFAKVGGWKPSWVRSAFRIRRTSFR